MRVDPYKKPPEPPAVAILLPDGTPLSEHGRHLDFDDWPRGTRCWGSFDTVRALVKEGVGEAVCWNGEEIHWRHTRLDDDGWKNRASDVHVLKIPEPAEPDVFLRGVVGWRNWLARYGAAPTGTTGSAAWSLLKATLDRTLFTSAPLRECPPLRWTIGGRQELGHGGRGVVEGRLELWDMPSAYANELGALPYGGWWILGSDHGRLDPEPWSRQNRPVFVQCTVRIPEGLPYGPLPKRPARRPSQGLASMMGCEFPRGRELSGVWGWEELRTSIEAGVRVIRIWEVFVHVSSWLPFQRWHEAIQEGRRMYGLRGQLAKMSGNALWGRFCMDSRGGQRTIRSRGNRRMVARPLVLRGGQPPAHDLAETVSSRVRARLFEAMDRAELDLISAHTDGLWISNKWGNLPNRRPDENVWRRKARATRIEILSPQNLRYWPPQCDAPVTVFSGVPAADASESFDRAWEEAGL